MTKKRTKTAINKKNTKRKTKMQNNQKQNKIKHKTHKLHITNQQ